MAARLKSVIPRTLPLRSTHAFDWQLEVIVIWCYIKATTDFDCVSDSNMGWHRAHRQVTEQETNQVAHQEAAARVLPESNPASRADLA